MRTLAISLAIASLMSPVWAHTNYTGYSGAPGRQTCALSCHGNPGGTVQITGFPTNYVPNQSYLLTISRGSGSSIRNFNASCRIGTGSINAGVISAGTGTATYNVSGETNGVHLSTAGQTSATFSWTAPAAGTGTVRLYCGAFQGTDPDAGLNSTIVLVSNESLPLPGPATTPSPADLATNVPVSSNLGWNGGVGATSHDVYFGTVNPPPFVLNQTSNSYDPPGDLAQGTLYFWRIDERNAAGVTPGSLWQFTTEFPPVGRCCLPNDSCATLSEAACLAAGGQWNINLTCDAPCTVPAPQALVIQPTSQDVVLNWLAVPGAVAYQVYRATTSDVAVIPGNLIGTTTNLHFTDTNVLALPQLRYFYVVVALAP